MRFLPTRVHGILDYAYGAALVAAPWVLGFAGSGPATYVPVALGIAYVLLGIFTDYEVGAIRAVPVPAHLAVDGLGGAFLAASPWVSGFADTVYLPHLVAGLFAVVASLVTETRVSASPPPYAKHDDMHAHPSEVSEDQARPPYPERF